jgi:pimeloyl-ACP methyl ester carboxylesterase
VSTETNWPTGPWTIHRESALAGALIPSFLGVIGAIAVTLLVRVSAASAAGQPVRVQGGRWLLAGRAYESAKLSTYPHLIVVIHGDAPSVNPSYQYVFAKGAAAALNDVVAVGILRPGYQDGMGGRSEGDRGFALADNYTVEDIASVASAAKALMGRYHAADLTLVGHSGGSTIAADILALFPRLARGALLVSCPCNVPAFRWGMMKHQWNPLWLIPVHAVSPQDHAQQIPATTMVRMVVGSADPVTPPPLSLAFARALEANGGNVQVLVLKDFGHEIFLHPGVLQQLRALMNEAGAEAPADSPLR